MAVENDGVEAILIDAEKVTRTVENILGNAVRYTPPGERVAVKLEPAGSDRARIMISNTGHEISKERLERWFEKFYRVDEARGSESGGAGLGLAIVKNLIEANDGSISAINENRVTTFTIVV